VIANRTACEVLLAAGVAPDVEFANTKPDSNLDYIHRRTADAEIYFVANRLNRSEQVTATFRVAGRAPELWNAVTGERRFAANYESVAGRTRVPLAFEPCGSWFVVFRAAAAGHPATAPTNAAAFASLGEVSGSWQVSFDPRWGGPGAVEFPALVSWPTRSESGIKHYSGTAVYRKSFDLPAAASPRTKRLFLDLGQVRELAEVKVNGKSCGIVWAPPFRVDVTDVVKPTGNTLEIEVVNFWPNRVIGDSALPEAQRLTKTNILELTAKTPLVESGLLGPVTLGTINLRE
jgi:hypothetical protein